MSPATATRAPEASAAFDATADGVRRSLVELYLDHGCPWSYMAFTALSRLAPEIGIRPTWRLLPIAGDRSVAAADAGMHAARLAAEWPEIAASAAADFGLRLRQPIGPADGRPAAAAIHLLRGIAPDREPEAHAALFAARFEAGQDISDPACLSALLGAFAEGFGEAFAALAPADLRAAPAEDTEQALQAGVRVVPTLVLNRRHVLLGAEPRDVLRLALANLTSNDPRGDVGPGRRAATPPNPIPRLASP